MNNRDLGLSPGVRPLVPLDWIEAHKNDIVPCTFELKTPALFAYPQAGVRVCPLPPVFSYCLLRHVAEPYLTLFGTLAHYPDNFAVPGHIRELNSSRLALISSDSLSFSIVFNIVTQPPRPVKVTFLNLGY